MNIQKVNLSSVLAKDSALLGEAEGLASALSSLFPQDDSGCRAVVTLLQSGLVEQLRQIAASHCSQLSDEALEHLLVQTQEKCQLTRDVAIEAWSNWCQVLAISSPTLGVASPSQLNPLVINLSGSINLDLIWCNPATFMMGSPSQEVGRDKSDLPAHPVTLTKGFYLGKYSVTWEQYQAIITDDKTIVSDDRKSCPVTSVDWLDSMAFCLRLQLACQEQLPKGYIFTLPTEAQWEYACRAGTLTALNNGLDLTDRFSCPNLDDLGWYRNNNQERSTHSVGEKLPNAWGFYDMHGNVFEWCYDFLQEDLPYQDIDPKGPSTGVFRVLHGGAWADSAYECRSAGRFAGFTTYSSRGIGFRLAAIPTGAGGSHVTLEEIKKVCGSKKILSDIETFDNICRQYLIKESLEEANRGENILE